MRVARDYSDQMDDGAQPPVVVRRSARRKRSVSARRQGDHYVVDIPARFSAAQEREWVARMTARLQAREHACDLDDAALLARAIDLNDRYLGGAAVPASVRWVTNQQARWGSCTPVRGSIRISHRLRGAPGWVLDYVLVHELAHLLVAKHDEHFWRLLAAYPQTERAKGFLEGVVAAEHLELAGPANADGEVD